MKVSDLIQSAMRRVGALGIGVTTSPERLAEGLVCLRGMLQSWSVVRIVVFASVKDTFSLVGGTATYTWGVGGVINTLRPNYVAGAYVSDGVGGSFPVDIISEGEYRKITLKDKVGRPSKLFFNPLYPFATVYVWPVPEVVEVVYLDSIKPFTEASSFDVVGSTIAFPPSYEEAIIYNLAIRLASSFGKVIPVEIADIATRAYDRILVMNAANKVEAIGTSLPASSGKNSADYIVVNL